MKPLPLLLMLTTAMAGGAWAASEIVVATRYLLPATTSHAHLYLYREDGKLLRQLTRFTSGQDTSPVFAPDGSTIVFTHGIPDKTSQVWSVKPRGGTPRRLRAAPAWYRTAHTSPFYGGQDSASPGESPEPGDKAPHFKAPDGSVEVVLREGAGEAEDMGNGEGHGSHYLLRDLKSGDETEMGKLPGFLGLYDMLTLTGSGANYLLSGPLRLAFFGLHLNSTDGDTCFALDLVRRRLRRLSPNWAAPIPLPGEAAFLTRTWNYYVPITGSKKTANCNYMEHWDHQLHRIRYAGPGAAVCYGASMYRPAHAPAVITMLKDGG